MQKESKIPEFTIPGAAATTLLARDIVPDTPLKKWPTEAFLTTSAELNAFDEVSSTAAVNANAVLLERGVGLLWDNPRMLHGRRPFSEITTSRRQRRIYGVRDAGRAN